MKTSRHVLVGLFVLGHERQGRVVRVTGETAVVECYSWLDGAPGTVELVPVAELMAGDGWKLFARHETFIAAADAESNRRYR